MAAPGDAPTCVRVIEAVAVAEETTPGEVDFTLHDHVPVDALDELGSADRGTWELQFEVPGHEVTVRSDGTILVDGRTTVQDH